MHKRRLGNSDLMVSELTLGSWLTYGGTVPDRQAEACVHAALDAGINCIDTANVYGRGAAESFLGKTLAGVPRDRYVLATKLFFPMSDDDFGLSAAQIHKQIDASLKRLATDYVDLYQCHRYDEQTPLEETLKALTEVVEAGKARYVGFSMWPPEAIEQAAAMTDCVRFVSSQPEYSLLCRYPEPEVIPLCRRLGIRQIVFCPLAQGVLTGKYRPGQLPEGSRAADPGSNEFMQRFLTEPILEAVAALAPLAAEVGLTMPQLALAWVLQEENVASAIIGASKPSQIEDNVGAAGVRLDDELMQKIAAIVDPVLPSD